MQIVNGSDLIAQIGHSTTSTLSGQINPDAPRPLTGLQDIFKNVIQAAIGFAGIAFFIMFLVGGFQYLTAGGDAAKTEAAKKTLTYAIAGLVFITLSYLALRFIATITGATGILNFQIFYQPK